MNPLWVIVIELAFIAGLLVIRCEQHHRSSKAKDWTSVQMYRYRWNRCGRKDQRCIVTARGAMNSCRVEFEDGHVMITSRNAVAKVRDWPPWRSTRVVFQAPADARYVCSDRGWWYYVRRSEIFAARWPTNDSYMMPKDRKRGRAAAESAHAASARI